MLCVVYEERSAGAALLIDASDAFNSANRNAYLHISKLYAHQLHGMQKILVRNQKKCNQRMQYKKSEKAKHISEQSSELQNID